MGKILIKTNGILQDKTIGYSSFLTMLAKYLLHYNIVLEAGMSNDCDLYLLNNLDQSLYNPNIKNILRMDGFGHEFNAVDKAKFLCQQCDHIIYQSIYVKEYSEHLLGKFKNCSIIYNGIEILGNINCGQNTQRINIGSIIHNWIQERSENCIKFLIAFRKFSEKFPNLMTYYVVGNTDSWEFKKIVKQDFNDLNIIFTGLLDRDNLDKLRRTLSFVVHLPKFGWSDNSIIESLNYGLPVLYLRGTATAELVKNAGTQIDDINDINGIVNKIKEMYDNLESYSNNALSRRYEFDINKIAEQYAKIIKSL